MRMLNLASAPIKTIALGVGAVALAIGAFWAYGESKEALGAANERNKAIAAAAAAFAQDVEKANEAGATLTAALDKLAGLEPRVMEKYKYVKQAAPLPIGCVPGPDRLRAISDAIDSANAAAGHAIRVRAGDKADDR